MTKKKDLKLYGRLKYHNSSSNATVKIRQLLLSPKDATGAIAEFYSAQVMQEKTENWGEEFDKNYRQLVIHDMIGKVSEIVDDECNKDRTIHLDVRVRVKLVVHHSSSILGLVKNMEVDEDVANEDCMICLEKLGEERELMCMPCSHLFHGDCITTWLENGNSCPVCRYDLLAN
ncbi:uncharacterized RING finger protein ZK637.14-like [Capsicum annuum]|uniref:uncharacterized RING finger protein ZK637.14-like n=1 Tax=Capsicum annuum TaxID=4072 RepID=UPI0007BFDB36|nr:uncharacterized RING finger protein ZK637.14-like [Capsicum annuum]